MNYKDIENATTSIRTQIKRVYKDMCDCKSPFLPPKDSNFLYLGTCLDDDQYDVVVCGEVKKGKSSFINAIIGEDLLPVNTDVTTSQVFRIVNNAEKKYELVFVDGSRKAIDRNDLEKYGSQIAVNDNGLPAFEIAIDYIEIHYPITFLPPNIAIVDTPGIGAVYADHERVTKRYLPNAAAVIFIMDPQNPLTAPEKSFLESALEVTDRVLFVMTKMDNYDSDIIINMVRRNEEILSPFEKRIWNNNIQILPMSSKILKEAAENNDETLKNLDILSSQFNTVQEALLKMVYSMIGLVKNIAFTNQLISYNRSVKENIKEAEQALNDNCNATKLLQDRLQLQNDFASQWGPESANYKDVVQSINDEANSLPNRIAIICSQTGKLSQSFRGEIDRLDTIDDAKKYADSLTTRIQDTIQIAVRDEVVYVTEKINSKLHDYSIDINDYVASKSTVNINGLGVDTINIEEKGLLQRIGNFRMGYFNILLFVGVGSIFGPIGTAAGLVAGVIASIFMSKEAKIKELQSKYRDYLNKAMIAAYNCICIESKPLSQTATIQRDIKQQAVDALRKVYDEQKSKVDSKIRELTEQINADTASRQQKRQLLNNIKTTWQAIDSNLVLIVQDIETLKKNLL